MTGARRLPACGAAVEIRRASLVDLDDLDAIEGRSFDRDRFPRRNLRRLMASRRSIGLIARSAGAPAGYAMLLSRAGSRIMRLYSVAVDPSWRGCGIGMALLSAAAEAARSLGADRLRLELRPSNRVALRLYERAGFTFLGRKPGYYDDGEDAIRMELTLRPAAGGGAPYRE
jgi:ribosomal protein S18 acetylase RimI-like enzyme